MNYASRHKSLSTVLTIEEHSRFSELAARRGLKRCALVKVLVMRELAVEPEDQTIIQKEA